MAFPNISHHKPLCPPLSKSSILFREVIKIVGATTPFSLASLRTVKPSIPGVFTSRSSKSYFVSYNLS